MRKIIYLAGQWCKYPTISSRDIADSFGLHLETVLAFFEYFREMTGQWFERETSLNNMKLGGPG